VAGFGKRSSHRYGRLIVHGKFTLAGQPGN
jgi:hypothetical protein